MQRHLTQIWGVFVAGALLAVAVPAAAQTVYAPGYAPPYSAPNSVGLTVQVQASVGGRCGFATGGAPNGSVNQPNFDVTGFDQTFNFKLDCTGAFRVGVVSANGGLKTNGSVPTGYVTQAPYDVQLNLVGNSQTSMSTCQAADLLPSSTGCAPAYISGGTTTNFSGPASTTKGLRVGGPATNGSDSSIRVVANAYAGTSVLVDGTYQDTLTITVSAAP